MPCESYPIIRSASIGTKNIFASFSLDKRFDKVSMSVFSVESSPNEKLWKQSLEPMGNGRIRTRCEVMTGGVVAMMLCAWV